MNTIIYRGVVFVIGIWTSILTYRVLGPEKRGLLAYLVFLLGLITSFSGLGLSASAVFLLGQNALSLKQLKMKIQGLIVLLSLLFCAICTYYFWFHMPPAAAAQYRTVRILVILVVPLSIASVLWNSIIYAENRIEIMNRSALIIQISSCIIITIAYLVNLLSLGVVFASVVFSSFIQVLYQFYASRPVFGISFDPTTYRSLLGLGVRSYLGDLASYANQRVSYFLVADLSGPAALGVFSLAILLAEKILQLTKVASLVLMPEIAREGNTEFARKRTELVARFSFLITLFIGILAVFLVPWIIPILYGEAYSGAVGSLLILIPGILMTSIAYILASYLCGVGKIWATSWPIIVTLPFLLVLLIFFLPKLGQRGASIATSVNMIMVSILIYREYLRHTGATLRDVLVPTREDFSLARSILKKKN